MVGRSALQFVQMAILARLLSPYDFGLMAMVLAAVTFVQVFTDLGVSNAIIHYQDVSADQLSSLYWLNVCTGFVLMLVLMVASQPISVLIFDQPELQPVLFAVSFTVLLTALGQQVRVVAEKSLRFSVLAKVEFASALVGFTIAVLWAWFAPSVYALAAGLLINSLVQALLLWLFAAQGWRPKLKFKFGEIRRFLKFGGYIVATNFVNAFNSQADILIAGKVFPATALGLYSLPRNLSLAVAGIVNPIVTRVGLPVMASAQDDRSFLKSVYLKTMRMTASVNFPIYVALAVFSEEVILVVFGQKWLESALLLAFLAVWGMFRSCSNPVGSLLLAVGRADLSFKWNLALLFVVPPALWLASQWGVVGLAAGQAALMAVLIVPGWYFLVWPHCGARGLEYAAALILPLAAALLAVAVGYLAVVALSAPVWRLFFAAAVAVPVYIGLSFAINRSWLLSMVELVSGRR